jgi:hypothetical protein
MPDLSRRWGRRRGPILAVAVLTMLAVAAPLRLAGALDGDPVGTAVATQDGWWNRLQGPQEGEPEGNPLRPALPALPPPPTVPGDATAVAVAGGQPVFVAAVGIQVDVPPGALVESLKLILKEAPSGQINSTGAKVVACAATTPWGPAKNAAWRDRPQSDCSLFQAEGVRGDDGTWTFDLTNLAIQWTDTFAAPLAQNGVVLGLDATTSPAPMQVAWSDFDTGNVIVEMVATASPLAPDTGFDTSLPAPTFAEYTPPLTEVPYAAPEIPLTVAGPAFVTDPLAFSTGPPAYTYATPINTDVPAPDETAELVAGPTPAPGSATLQAQPVVGFWEEIPGPTVLLVPLALALALLVALILGPAGRPLPFWPRAGGLSRALARRSGGDAVV